MQLYKILKYLTLCFILYLLVSQVWIHDWYLWQFSRSYANLNHPPTTHHVKSYKRLGLLIANGNHIDLLAGELRSYSGSRQRIIDWYSKMSVPSRLEDGEKVAVEVVFFDNGFLSSGEIGLDRPDILEEILIYARTIKPATNLYSVYILDSNGHDPGIDIRVM